MDLTIEGKVYYNGTLNNCCIGIENGKITDIKKILKSDDHYNFNSKLIIPAGIDIHVHFRDPGMTHKEDFSTGSKSAAFGGISCVFDMPNTIPQTDSIQNIKEKIRIAEKKSYIDFGVYSSITNSNINKISEIKKYCNGFKIYLGESTNSINFDTKNLSLLKNIDFADKPILVHAEDKECIDSNKIKEKNLLDHIKSRPSICEKRAIKNIISNLHLSKLKIHICHISSYDGIQLLKKYNNITCGTTSHHLFLDIENKKKYQSFFKTNPPIRNKFEREHLFKCIQNNSIDIIESDHAPHTYNEKNVDFDNAPSGVPGVETMMPIFLFLVNEGRLSINRMVKLLCEKPSEILNIPKGKIEIGKDADLIIVDLKRISKIHQDKLHYKCGWSPYENFKAIFPKHVFIRGQHIIRDYEMMLNKGFGNFIGG
jgi:dihydroorotase